MENLSDFRREICERKSGTSLPLALLKVAMPTLVWRLRPVSGTSAAAAAAVPEPVVSAAAAAVPDPVVSSADLSLLAACQSSLLMRPGLMAEGKRREA